MKKQHKKSKEKNKPQFTDEEVYTPTLDIGALLNDPAIEAAYQKHYKGDKLYQETTSDTEETFPSFSTKKLELTLKVIRGGNEPGETQRVGDKIEKELNRRKQL
ncbi:MAG: hypothetical protein ACI9M9_000068 [Flavobacteriaceae bacterium]|jgi:hypothetical protein